jgi:hypothetical protein
MYNTDFLIECDKILLVKVLLGSFPVPLIGLCGNPDLLIR